MKVLLHLEKTLLSSFLVISARMRMMGKVILLVCLSVHSGKGGIQVSGPRSLLQPLIPGPFRGKGEGIPQLGASTVVPPSPQ